MATARFQAASCTARGTVTVLESRIAEHAAILSRSQLFSGIPGSECLRIAGAARLREYARDDFLFEQGQPVRHILLIESGCVKLTQLSSGGSEVILWLRGSGDAVGVFGIPAQYPHTCSARAVVRCRAFVWDWSRLDSFPASRQVRSNISHIVSERIGELEERFREIATEKVSRRVACALVRILRHVGKPAAGGFDIFLSREEIAQLTGTTVFTISRLMSRWSDLGLVEPRREAVLVRDPERLLQLGSESSD